jgi:uncharacterized membrane protein HdeD (DUF308 family)
MVCQRCGKEVAGNPTFCPSCGARVSEGQSPKRTGTIVVAGILDIIDGCLNVLGFLGLVVAIAFVSDEPDTLAILIPLAVLLALKGILAIVGGINALQRKNWVMALVGAIAAALPFSLLGIIALILTAVSRDQFNSRMGST